MLVQRWVTPGAVALVMLTSGISGVPSTPSTAAARAPLMVQCAHGYSGCIGVLSNGCQIASRSVAALSSMSPLRIAVTGRQNSYVYFACFRQKGWRQRRLFARNLVLLVLRG